MILLWKGKGILVVLILAASGILILGADLIFGKGTFEKNHWLIGLCLVVSGFGSFLLGQSLEQEKGKIYLDPQTGQQVVFKKQHSLYGIPVKYWAYIQFVLGPIVGLFEFFK